MWVFYVFWGILLAALVVVAMFAWTHGLEDRTTVMRKRADEIDIDEPVRVHLFFATWCDACTAAKPEWEAFVQAFDGQTYRGRRVTCVTTDASAMSDSARAEMTRYNVTAFPSVVLHFRNVDIPVAVSITKAHLQRALDEIGTSG